MPNSTLSFASSSSFRDVLMAKNLASYSVSGVYTPPAGPLNYEITLSQSPVIDSPNDLIANDPFANQLYPLNEYGPSGGYDTVINFNGPPLPVNPNQGPYEPLESLVLENSDLYLNKLPISPVIINKYIPLQGKYNYSISVGDISNNDKLFLPYVYDNTVKPVPFIPSIYQPYEVLSSSDPVGSDGRLSQDNFLAKIAVKQLNFLFQERIKFELYQETIGLLNVQALSDPFNASLVVTGQEPLINRNWRITVPEFPVTRAVDFASRISGVYWPVSFIPGDYFDENTKGGLETQQTSTALNVVNQLTGGFLGPILNIKRNPSQIFLANTGNAQRSALFNNLDFNRYQPGYKKDFGGILGIADALVDLASSIINPNGSISGGFYVGSVNTDPSTITSPSEAIPVNPYGEQVETPVYGPSEMSILFEGNQGDLNFGLAGKSLTDDGGIDGGLVWVSPKYKGDAGFHATPGGGSGTKDEEFNEISSKFDRSQSTNVDFKENSILDNTQRLVDSADNVSGINRLKHVGNAINQVSKVFNDGYKEMTKGSQVISYKDDTDGSQKGLEYCRVFTKDTPYYTYADLQKTDGITTSGRRFTYSVLDNTYNLNIAPLKGNDSTNIFPDDASGKGGYVKKYMFSIENLAWRTSSRPGYTYDELPVCERGPNGGRIMWFPPYNLQFNDTSQADWGQATFLGRPEPVYTYKSTTRTGSISWTMIVDHPSVMNTIVEKQLKGASKERIESIIDSFFAGCVKYDIYQLAIKFNTISVNDLYTYQEILSNPRLTDVETIGQVNREIPKKDSGNAGTPTADVSNNNQTTQTETDNSVADFENKYLDFAFYFENDIPGKNPDKTTSANFGSIYETYVSASNIEKYKKNSAAVFKTDDNDIRVGEFFDTVIKSNFKKIAEGDSNFITDAYDIINKGLGTISIELEGSASAVASVTYNKNLSERRVDSIKRFLKEKTIGEKNLGKFFDEGKITIKNVTTTGEEIVIPKQSVEEGSPGNTGTTENSGTGQDVDCKVNQKPTKPGVPQDTKNKNIAQIYSTSAMACRRVRVKTITVTKSETTTTTTTARPVDVPPTQTGGETSTIPVKKPQPEINIIKKIKEGISKKILRNLLSECDYFQVIKENSPMLYDSFKEKIKYFNPAFHSMTPEGLNSRLTFLNQCVRPGETIPVISDNNVKSLDAVNTSFGSPPVLILRIGDFYNTKIIPDNVSFTYDPLQFDMNPEGIGVQPMLAKVTLSFKMIGGMGLKEPVDQLQNALSFNYYANTEIYDERAVWTEDTSALDKMVVDAIVAKQPSPPVNNTVAQQSNDAGQTIGEIKTTTPLTPSGETGEMSYMKIMDKLYDDSQTYFTNIFNSLDELRAKTNYALLALICTKRNFFKGDLKMGGNTGQTVNILGKPVFQENLDKLFEQVINDINNNKNPIVEKLIEEGFTGDGSKITMSILKNNLTKYVKSVKATLFADIATVVNSKIGTQQQEYVQTLRKVIFVNSKTDGRILEDGSLKIYNLLSGGEFDLLVGDFTKVKVELNKYYDLLKDTKYDYPILPPAINNTDNIQYTTKNDFNFVPTSQFETVRFYMIMGRLLSDKNKVKEFTNKILTPNIVDVKKPKKLKRVFENIVDDLVDLFKDELKDENKTFTKFKKSSEYEKYLKGLDELFYKKGLPRLIDFTTEPDANEQSNKEKNLVNLYKGDPEKVNEFETFDGKIKFN